MVASRGQAFSITTDLAALIEATVDRLNPGGILLVSTNYRKMTGRGAQAADSPGRVRSGVSGHRHAQAPSGLRRRSGPCEVHARAVRVGHEWCGAARGEDQVRMATEDDRAMPAIDSDRRRPNVLSGPVGRATFFLAVAGARRTDSQHVCGALRHIPRRPNQPGGDGCRGLGRVRRLARITAGYVDWYRNDGHCFASRRRRRHGRRQQSSPISP